MGVESRVFRFSLTCHINKTIYTLTTATMTIRIVRERSRQVTQICRGGSKNRVSSEYSITSGLGNIRKPERDTFIRLLFMQVCTFIKMRLFRQFFGLLDFLKKDVFWYRIYLLRVNWCCHSVVIRGRFFVIKQNTPQRRLEVIFDLLLSLESLVSNPCLRVYYFKSKWIWFLGFRTESKWALPVNYSSRPCRASTN